METKLQPELKKTAKRLYFKNVKAEQFRQNFLKQLEKLSVADKRNEGYWCTYCKKFSKKPVAFPNKNEVIFLNDDLGKAKQIFIVHGHYDECRGWN